MDRRNDVADLQLICYVIRVDAIVKVISDIVFTGLLVAVVIVGFYTVKHRHLKGLTGYLGLSGAPPKAIGAAVAISLVNGGVNVLDWTSFIEMLGVGSFATFQNSNHTTGGQLLETGTTGTALVIAAVLKGAVQTALLEEIFFRGFIAKRLFNRLGFHAGNIAQSLIFAVLHMSFPFLLGIDDPWSLALFFGFVTGLLAWVIGYVNERLGEGSILPGWIIHGIGNVMTYVAAVL